jgi:tRNA (guanine37-N1)-methyltransferase
VKVCYLTIFPKLFENFLQCSLIGKALNKGILESQVVNIRDFADPPHYKVDDAPYGGGPGMVMKVEPIFRAVKSLPKAHTILLSASGKRFTQADAIRLSKLPAITFICGRYEGVDKRVSELVCDEEISLGEFVCMGGEAPAMVITESILRLVPGVIGNEESLIDESHNKNNLEAPQYTRPEIFEGKSVPQVLLSGNHEEIRRWRRG